MLLDVSQNTIVKAAPTAIDSLKRSISALNLKVDSLQKVTERAEIGKEFFSDTISTNLYMFATIIGLAALVSWGVIGGMLLLHKRKVYKEVMRIVDTNVKTFSDISADLQYRLDSTIYDVNRAMYFVSDQHKEEQYAFDWALTTAVSLIPISNDKDENIIFSWVDISIGHLNNIEVGETFLIDMISDFNEKLAKLENLNMPKITSGIEKLKQDFYHKVYTQLPPANLMENHTPSETLA